MRIVIAEDESAISMQYQIVLEERGHEVTITNNGEDCFEVYLTALIYWRTTTSNISQHLYRKQQY